MVLLQEEGKVEFLFDDPQDEMEEMGEVCISVLPKMKILSLTINIKRSLKLKLENQEEPKISTELMEQI
jgi:hypothetical protein